MPLEQQGDLALDTWFRHDDGLLAAADREIEVRAIEHHVAKSKRSVGWSLTAQSGGLLRNGENLR